MVVVVFETYPVGFALKLEFDALAPLLNSKVII
jgi:hypothetical protein